MLWETMGLNLPQLSCQCLQRGGCSFTTHPLRTTLSHMVKLGMLWKQSNIFSPNASSKIIQSFLPYLTGAAHQQNELALALHRDWWDVTQVAQNAEISEKFHRITKYYPRIMVEGSFDHKLCSASVEINHNGHFSSSKPLGVILINISTLAYTP